MSDYEAIYRRYFGSVYRYLLSLCCDPSLAEELTQAAFFAALKKIDSFREDCAVETWLIGIARNLCFDHWRRQKHRAALPPEGHAAAPSAEASPEALFFRSENISRSHQLMHALPEPYKEVFMLRVFGELRYAAIAELFSKTESWARVTYYRAKQTLAAQIRKEDGHE
jgi:RNA polymerase sigma-70 factor, ECF subfamily